MEDGAIDFRALRGQDDYFDELNRRYAKLGAQWLTPGEIFSPYYADAVVNYVLETHRGDEDEDGDGTPLCTVWVGSDADPEEAPTAEEAAEACARELGLGEVPRSRPVEDGDEPDSFWETIDGA